MGKLVAAVLAAVVLLGPIGCGAMCPMCGSKKTEKTEKTPEMKKAEETKTE
jgi:hypothetical protein